MAIADSFLKFRGFQENMKPAAGTSLDIRRARLVIGRIVNLKTARALGITLPPAIMIQATEFIE